MDDRCAPTLSAHLQGTMKAYGQVASTPGAMNPRSGPNRLDPPGTGQPWLPEANQTSNGRRLQSSDRESLTRGPQGSRGGLVPADGVYGPEDFEHVARSLTAAHARRSAGKLQPSVYAMYY